MSRLEERQAAMRARFKSELPRRMRRNYEQERSGRECMKCGTPFVPLAPDSEVCGLCKVRAKRLVIQ